MLTKHRCKSMMFHVQKKKVPSMPHEFRTMFPSCPHQCVHVSSIFLSFPRHVSIHFSSIVLHFPWDVRFPPFSVFSIHSITVKCPCLSGFQDGGSHCLFSMNHSYEPFYSRSPWIEWLIDLVGGLEHFLFSQILGIIIPIDVHIFQRGGPTTNQRWWIHRWFFWNLWTIAMAIAVHIHSPMDSYLILVNSWLLRWNIKP